MLFRKALLAVDLSKSSDDLVNCVKDLKNLGISDITLVTAVSTSSPDEFDTSHLEAKLQDYAAHFSDEGFQSNWKLIVKPGNYAPVTILETAEAIKADLLILGHRGHNRIAEFFLGSVANEILHRANIPLLLIRVSDDPADDNVSICKGLTSHILVATDFSENADKALTIFQNANLKSSKVTLVHVQTRTNEDGRENDLLVDRIEELNSKGVSNVSAKLLEGNTAFEINTFAEAQNVDLVIMGSQGKGFIQELFIGSNSIRFARITNKPLLLIPARK